jgi:cystathionine beta-synthase
MHSPSSSSLTNSSTGEKIYDYIYETTGNTPMVRLQKIPKMEGVECELLAKCEFMNPGGSVKDRVAIEMFLNAEQDGKLKAGDTVVEATSGNAGVGFCMMAACRGYKMIITIPQRMSNEKISVLKAFGAEVIRTPDGIPHDHPLSSYSQATAIAKTREGVINFNQYSNKHNPDAHYKGTGQEIFDQCGGKLDYVFIGAGTGGTITGVAKKLKELNPDIKVIGIDPVGSTMAEPASLNSVKKPFQVEGIGHDFIPDVLDRSLVDAWVKTDDQISFRYARALISQEGMLCGASSGSAIEGMIKYLKENDLDKNPNIRCVCILPDSIRNYLTKFCSDDWLVKKGLEDITILENPKHPLYGRKLKELKLKSIQTFPESTRVSDCLEALSRSGDSAVPIVENGVLKGIATKNSLLLGLSTGNLAVTDPALKGISREVAVIDDFADLSCVESLLRTEEVLFVKRVDNEQKINTLSVVSSLDLLKLIHKETSA